MDQNISQLITKFSTNSSKPELYLSVQSGAAKSFKTCTKTLYDLAKSEEDKANDTALPELIITGFDDEQIWQELELQNEPIINDLLSGISRLSAKGSLNLLGDDTGQEGTVHKTSQRVEEDGSSADEEMDDDMADRMDEEAQDSEQNLEDESDSDKDIAAIMKKSQKQTYDSDESEEEKYLKDLLEKATRDPGDGEDDSAYSDDEGLFHADNDDGMNESGSEDDGLTELDNLFKDSSNGQVMNSQENRDLEKAGQVFGKSGVSRTFGKKQKRKTIVDDKFFSMADMEEFLEQEDRREERKIAAERGEDKRKTGTEDSDDETSDAEEREVLDMLYQEDVSESDEEDENSLKSSKDIKYADFFGSQQTTSGEDVENDDDSEEEAEVDEDTTERSTGDTSGKQGGATDLFTVGQMSDSEGEDLQDVIGGARAKSTYEKRKEKLGQRVQNMEEAALEEKPWQLMGEVVAAARPMNSLLEEDLEFDQQTKTAPIITEETTKSLEDIIKQRIKDKVFDDVERKEKPKEEAFEYKKRIALDQEKSKKSLGEVYEEEYLKQTQEEEDEKEDPQREDIRKMLQSLFLKLDALSNFQYTPKPAAPEVKIVNNMPSITMEEVQPVSVSEAALLAPEEVKEKEKREMKGATEKTKTDKLRERKDKKIGQRKKKLAKERKQKVLEKIAPALGNKYAKERAMKELEKQSKTGKNVSVIKDKSSKKTGLTSSKQFFTQLQEEVTTHIQAKKAVKQKKEKKRHSGSKLKL